MRSPTRVLGSNQVSFTNPPKTVVTLTLKPVWLLSDTVFHVYRKYWESMVTADNEVNSVRSIRLIFFFWLVQTGTDHQSNVMSEMIFLSQFNLKIIYIVATDMDLSQR